MKPARMWYYLALLRVWCVVLCCVVLCCVVLCCVGSTIIT